MLNEDDARLKHILDAAKEIEHFLANKTEAQFRGDRLLLLGVQKLIEIIGEAANQLGGIDPIFGVRGGIGHEVAIGVLKPGIHGKGHWGGGKQ
jgi:hypothetical protein